MSETSPDPRVILDQLDELEHASTKQRDRETARAWSTAIREVQASLEHRDHSIVFIGGVGVGKTSLISALSELRVGPPPTDRPSLKEGAVLAISAGRTTVCEVRIRAAHNEDPGLVGLLLEPIATSDMEREIIFYAQGEWRRRQLSAKSKGEDDSDPVSLEIHRAIRSMTSYQWQQEPYIDEEGRKRLRNIRPLDKSILDFDTEDKLAAHLIERASLSARTRTAWWWHDFTEASLKQLKQRFEAVNQGDDAEAMLPQRLTVVVPSVLPNSELDLNHVLIDSRGLDGAIESRRDLQTLLRDPQAITILCASFKDAPGESLRGLLQSAANDGELRRKISTMLMILLDHGDSDQVNGANGDRELGQEIKIDECHVSLEALRLDPPLKRSQILALDTLRDAPVRLSKAIDASLIGLRQARSETLQRHLANASEFLASAGEELQSALRESLAQQLRQELAKQVSSEPPLRDPLSGVYEAIQGCRYASVVYAACRRNGIYVGLDLYAATEAAAARAATAWIERLTAAAMKRIDELREDDSFAPIRNDILLLRELFNEGKVRVIRDYSTRVGLQVAKTLREDAVWQRCSEEWGHGFGFKDRVIGHLQAWSERHDLTEHEHTAAEREIPLLREVAHAVQPPRFTLHVDNLRALRRTRWTPESISALIGANGTGKSTLLNVLRLFRLTYERGLPEAVNAVLGGSSNLRSWGISEDERVHLALEVTGATWQIELSTRGNAGDYLACERFLDGDREIFSRDSLGDFRYRDTQIEGSRQVGLRALIDRGVHEPVLRRFAAVLQSISVFHDPDLWSLRVGSRTTDDRYLETRGANALTMLRRWHQEHDHRHRYRFVIDGLMAAFPNLVSDLGFSDAGSTLVAQVYKAGRESPSPLASEANGVLQLLVLFCNVASMEDEGIVAIDEPENCLHPYALRVFLRRIGRWAKQHHLTILLATHSTVLLDELPPEQVFVMKPANDDEHTPTRLDELYNPEWLAEFKVGELYEQGEIGSNKDPAQ